MMMMLGPGSSRCLAGTVPDAFQGWQHCWSYSWLLLARLWSTSPGATVLQSVGAGGAPGCTSQGKPPALARPSQGGAPSPAAAPRWGSSIQPQQLRGERLRCAGLGMASCRVPLPAGPRLSRMGDSQVSSRVPVLTFVPLWHPHSTQQPRPGAGKAAELVLLQAGSPQDMLPPCQHNRGGPRGERAREPPAPRPLAAPGCLQG